MMRFAHPEWLWLIPLCLPVVLAMGRAGGLPAITLGSTAVAEKVGRPGRGRFGWIRGILRFLALASLLVALARPQLGETTTSVQASGVDLMLAIDVSGSMEARDMDDRSRLEVVEEVVADFVEARPNDRIGLVAFAGAPYLVSPLTLDHDWLQLNLDRLDTSLVDEPGTAVGSALASATSRLTREEAESRVVVLLTDGASNAGSISPELAAKAAATQDVTVHTIGVGRTGRATIPGPDGRPVVADVQVDEATLQAIADTTGGQFWRATDADALASIYDRIDQLEKTTRELQRFEHWDERFAWPALGGLGLLGLELLLTVLFRRLP